MPSIIQGPESLLNINNGSLFIDASANMTLNYSISSGKKMKKIKILKAKETVVGR
jgi:hypothetical protein